MSTRVNPNSWNSLLCEMADGERRYFETTLDRYADAMRLILPARTRRPKELANVRFSTSLFTAVGTKAGDVRYLICLERVGKAAR